MTQGRVAPATGLGRSREIDLYDARRGAETP
jgi:hypothetical protein